MASKTAQPEKGESSEELLENVEQTLDRLRVMYEQYFLGIQKQAPGPLHTDVERKIRDLLQANLRNTALRYRFATLQQKFSSYNAYWRRTLRQIENGTYARNLHKIGRNAARTGAEIPEEILAAMPKAMRDQVMRDRAAAVKKEARRKQDGKAQPDTAAAAAARPEAASDELLELDAFLEKEAPMELPPDELADVVAMIKEPTELRRSIKAARGPHVLNADDGDLDIDSFFAAVEAEGPAVVTSPKPAESPVNYRSMTRATVAPVAGPPGPPQRPSQPTGAPPGPPQRQSQPMAAQPGPPQRQSQPMAAQPGPPQRQSQPMAAQPGPPQRQSQPMAAQPGPPQRQSQPMAAQPGPPQRQSQPMAAQPGPLAAQTSPSPRPSRPVVSPVFPTPSPAPAPSARAEQPGARRPTTVAPPIPSIPSVPRPAAAAPPAVRPTPAPAPRAAAPPAPVVPTRAATPPAGTPVAPTRATPHPMATPVATAPPARPMRPRSKTDPDPPRASPPPGMTEADVNALHASYRKAKEMVGEDAGPGSYGKLLKTINAQAPKIMEQYKAKGVDFQVVVKDNQVIIRAKPKP